MGQTTGTLPSIVINQYHSSASIISINREPPHRLVPSAAAHPIMWAWVPYACALGVCTVTGKTAASSLDAR